MRTASFRATTARRCLVSLAATALLLVASSAIAQTCDFDMDGFSDIVDNCPRDANVTQANQDEDQLGDECDPVNDFDYDADGVINDEDNCPLDSNATQVDADADGIGDACDAFDHRDIDEDGVPNEVDNCPLIANPSQENTDGDTLGNDCDPVDDLDYDADGVLNETDNCPLDPNATQVDSDVDGVGDVCDIMGAPGTDDYQCYGVKDLKQPPFEKIEGVSLEDELTTASADLLKVASVCAPVDRNHAGIVDPLTYRCCYKVKAPKLVSKPTVSATEALQDSTLELRKASTVCVPCRLSVAP